jgi:hypothetical protein
LVPGSGMEKSRINIPDPQHCVLGIETDPNSPDLDRHGLDADPDPEKIMRIRPDLGILIHNTKLEYMNPNHLCKLSYFLKIYNLLIGSNCKETLTNKLTCLNGLNVAQPAHINTAR